MKTIQEEFSFLPVERCGNRFVLTRTVLPKAVILAYAAIWKVVKLCMFTFIVLLLFALQKNTAKETLYHRTKIWSRCVSKGEWIRQHCHYLAEEFFLLTGNEHICEVQNIALDWILIFIYKNMFGFYVTTI